jgi:hypothetical protein
MNLVDYFATDHTDAWSYFALCQLMQHYSSYRGEYVVRAVLFSGEFLYGSNVLSNSAQLSD